MKEEWLNEKLIKDEKILNVYRFGSLVYGSYDYNSDEELIVVTDKWFNSMNLNVHVFTIKDFQRLLNNGEISNYASMNYVLKDLWELSKDYKYEELWEKIDQKYHKLFNGLSFQFKQFCPKDLKEVTKKDRIRNILENHEVYTNELLNDLLNEY